MNESKYCLVAKTCGGVTNINGTFFQSPGYPSTFDRSQILFTRWLQIQFTVSEVSSDFRDWSLDLWSNLHFLQTPTKYKIGSVNSWHICLSILFISLSLPPALARASSPLTRRPPMFASWGKNVNSNVPVAFRRSQGIESPDFFCVSEFQISIFSSIVKLLN